MHRRPERCNTPSSAKSRHGNDLRLQRYCSVFTKVTDIRSQMLLVQKPRIEAWRRTNVKGCGEKQERRRRQQRHEDTDDTQSQKEASEYGSQSFHAVKLAVLRKHVRPTSFFIFGWTLNASFRSFAKIRFYIQFFRIFDFALDTSLRQNAKKFAFARGLFVSLRTLKRTTSSV